jgi:pyruvate dehydrogenase E2 component (dihydrolipoamide acetyltransferase)
MAEFVMPSLGADMEAGTLVSWHVAPGDTVTRGDIMADVDTDKGVIEIECFESGTVERLLVTPGTKVPVGTPLAIIRGAGGPATTPAVPGVLAPTTPPVPAQPPPHAVSAPGGGVPAGAPDHRRPTTRPARLRFGGPSRQPWHARLARFPTTICRRAST